MFKTISTQEALALLSGRKFSELAYMGSDGKTVFHCEGKATLDRPLSTLLARNWLRRVEPMRKVFQWGTVPNVDSGCAYDLHINVAEFEGRKIQVIVEEVE